VQAVQQRRAQRIGQLGPHHVEHAARRNACGLAQVPCGASTDVDDAMLAVDQHAGLRVAIQQEGLYR
jgi:hypothetical protein